MISRSLDYLAQPRVIWVTFGATVLLTLSFVIIMAVWQFQIIDEMSNAEQISTHIRAMSADQRVVHAWMTGTIDVIYPFAYASFFIGVAIRYFGRFGTWLAIPSFLVIPADLIEGFAQIMLLNGYDEIIPVKVLVTPVKLILFFAGLAITATALVPALYKKIT